MWVRLAAPGLFLYCSSYLCYPWGFIYFICLSYLSQYCYMSLLLLRYLSLDLIVVSCHLICCLYLSLPPLVPPRPRPSFVWVCGFVVCPCLFHFSSLSCWSRSSSVYFFVSPVVSFSVSLFAPFAFSSVSRFILLYICV